MSARPGPSAPTHWQCKASDAKGGLVLLVSKVFEHPSTCAQLSPISSICAQLSPISSMIAAEWRHTVAWASRLNACHTSKVCTADRNDDPPIHHTAHDQLEDRTMTAELKELGSASDRSRMIGRRPWFWAYLGWIGCVFGRRSTAGWSVQPVDCGQIANAALGAASESFRRNWHRDASGKALSYLCCA